VRQRQWSVLAFAVGLATGVVLAVAPLSQSSSCVGGVDQAASCTSSRQSLLDEEGSSVLFVLALPMLIMAVPVAMRSRRIALAAAIAITILTVLGAMSIGVFVLPTAVLAWMAVASAGKASAAQG
jgi:hypothetical protein